MRLQIEADARGARTILEFLEAALTVMSEPQRAAQVFADFDEVDFEFIEELKMDLDGQIARAPQD